MPLLPGGALVNFLELNCIVVVDESVYSNVRDDIFHFSVMRFCVQQYQHVSFFYCQKQTGYYHCRIKNGLHIFKLKRGVTS